jgi:8-oxo-dGTP diphosphatase
VSCSSSRCSLSTAAVLLDDDKLFLVKRAPGGDLGGKWELPGGKVDPGETPEDALARELREELGVRASVGPCIATVGFRHGGVRFTLRGHRVEADVSQARLREHVSMRRCTIEEALLLDLASSDRKLLRKIRSRLGKSR